VTGFRCIHCCMTANAKKRRALYELVGTSAAGQIRSP
jgi:hypothetical protein